MSRLHLHGCPACGQTHYCGRDGCYTARGDAVWPRVCAACYPARQVLAVDALARLWSEVRRG